MPSGIKTNVEIGQRFNRLQIVKEVEKSKFGRRKFKCLCDCGTICYPTLNALTQEKSKSCGCLKLEELTNTSIQKMFDPAKGTKSCTQCGETKPTSAFYSRTSKFTAACKQCSRKRIEQWRKKNPELVKKYGRTYMDKNWRRLRLEQYGITLEIYEQIFKDQEGRCAICKELPGKKRLNVDHCHETGKVRGLLCTNCNHALGAFKDKPEHLDAGAAYLRRCIDYTQDFVDPEEED